MYSAIQSKFTEAVAKESLLYSTPTQVRKTVGKNVDLVLSKATQLAKKPQSTGSSGSSGEQQSPWLPPDENLLVKKLDQYSVVLNKYAISKYHFLLVTNAFQKQSFPLTEEDWDAAYKLLREVNKESGKRHVGFFNCGPESGASIEHKHLQFLTLPDNFRPFVDSTPEVGSEGATADERVPFSHFIVGLQPNADTEQIVMRYSEALGRVLTVHSRSNPGAQRPPISYNLVFTEEWIMVTPRKAAKTESGISLNALATIGLMLAKSDEQLSELETSNINLLEEVGFPFEKVEHYAPDFQGYTHY